MPPGSKRDAVDELHADLALVDVWVADTIIPLVEDGVWKPPRVDIGAGIRRVRDRTVSLRESASGEDQELLDRYLEYVELLDSLYNSFRTEHADKFT